MKITVIQPKYYAGQHPDAAIADFLLQEAEKAEPGSLVVLPEYANAGGLSQPEKLLSALPRADQMLKQVEELAARKGIYVSINVLITGMASCETAPICLTRRAKLPLCTTRFIFLPRR